MAEVLGRWVTTEDTRMPAAGLATWVLYYTAEAMMTYSFMVCNGEASDAHISIWVVPGSVGAYVGTGEPPPYTVIHKKQRIESDGTDGNSWVSPVIALNEGDRVVVQTDVSGVTFYGHGFKFVAEVTP
jgi:hypothetical protein